jgi:glutamate-ammonia-ligase adenylyltransferase
LSSDFENALREAVEGTPLATQLPLRSAPFLERRGKDLAGTDVPATVVRGLASVLASDGETARYLALRPALLQRLAHADTGSLERRAGELATSVPSTSSKDLEAVLDDLRLFRRDETAFAATLDLAGLADFDKVLSFLSVLAEIVVQRALAAAEERTPAGPEGGLSVLGLGKLAGRELTYHSDLDLIFLFEGGPDEIVATSRIAQRLIHYLTTPTGAGIAYAVDARLRPSGRQGLLVTSFDAYARYQIQEARTWEHLAIVRGRAVAGDVDRAAPLVRRVQDAIRARRTRPWQAISELRERIAAERTSEIGGRVGFKTAPGGLMDVDFLAAGAQLEIGADGEVPTLPSVPAMLEAAIRGPRVERILAAYRFLRLLAARARWVVGRAVENLPADPEKIGTVAELVSPGLSPTDLLERTHAFRQTVREATESVLEAGTIEVLAG